jgi:hypothetical protein
MKEALAQFLTVRTEEYAIHIIVNLNGLMELLF